MRWYEAYLAIPEAERPWTRSFTVRAYDRARNEMTVDFVLLGDTGPASRWAGPRDPVTYSAWSAGGGPAR